MRCPKCDTPAEKGLPCPSCGYIDGAGISRPDIERELLGKGYVLDEGLGMYYLLEPGDENLRPSVTWYDPVTDKYEVIYDDPGEVSVSGAAPDGGVLQDMEPGEGKADGYGLSPDDKISDFEIDLSAFEDIPEPPPAQGQRAAGGIFGLFAGKPEEKKVPKTIEIPGSGGNKRIRQTNMVTKPSRLPAWLTPERLRWLVLAGAGVIVILLIVLGYNLGKNSARPDPTQTPDGGMVSASPSDDGLQTPMMTPTDDPGEASPTPENMEETPTPDPLPTSPSVTESPVTQPPVPTPTRNPDPDPTGADINKATPTPPQTDPPTPLPPTQPPTDPPTPLPPTDPPSDPPQDT